MSTDSLSLKNLTMFDFNSEAVRKGRAEREAEKQRFKDMYGDRWQDEYLAMRERRNQIVHRKFLNHIVYHTGAFLYDGTHRPAAWEIEELEQRCREVYGDQYDVIKADRVDWDPRVAERLVAEAIQKGNCDELPDVLIDLYNERLGDAQ